jgi:hypothetical protein
MPTLVAVTVPLLMTVAKTVAGFPTATDRLDGKTAATSDCADAGSVWSDTAIVARNTAERAARLKGVPQRLADGLLRSPGLLHLALAEVALDLLSFIP